MLHLVQTILPITKTIRIAKDKDGWPVVSTELIEYTDLEETMVFKMFVDTDNKQTARKIAVDYITSTYRYEIYNNGKYWDCICDWHCTDVNGCRGAPTGIYKRTKVIETIKKNVPILFPEKRGFFLDNELSNMDIRRSWEYPTYLSANKIKIVELDKNRRGCPSSYSIKVKPGKD